MEVDKQAQQQKEETKERKGYEGWEMQERNCGIKFLIYVIYRNWWKYHNFLRHNRVICEKLSDFDNWWGKLYHYYYNYLRKWKFHPILPLKTSFNKKKSCSKSSCS